MSALLAAVNASLVAYGEGRLKAISEEEGTYQAIGIRLLVRGFVVRTRFIIGRVVCLVFAGIVLVELLRGFTQFGFWPRASLAALMLSLIHI